MTCLTLWGVGHGGASPGLEHTPAISPRVSCSGNSHTWNSGSERLAAPKKQALPQCGAPWFHLILLLLQPVCDFTLRLKMCRTSSHFSLFVHKLEQWGPHPSRSFPSGKGAHTGRGSCATKQPFPRGTKPSSSPPALQPSQRECPASTQPQSSPVTSPASPNQSPSFSQEARETPCKGKKEKPGLWRPPAGVCGS